MFRVLGGQMICQVVQLKPYSQTNFRGLPQGNLIDLFTLEHLTPAKIHFGDYPGVTFVFPRGEIEHM